MFKRVLVTDGATALPARRWHRALTIPALVVAFTALVVNRYVLVSVLVFPPLVAMPSLIRAATRPTARRIEEAHQALRAAGHIMCGIACILAIWCLREGVPDAAALTIPLIELGASVALLLAAGIQPRETRLAGSVMLIAFLMSLAAVPLIWFGAGFLALFPTALAMFAGGLWWLIEAEMQPAVETNLPVATVL
ncbi:MAG: hypothetical protein H0T46_28720 [Deltaproteobacteria bacterium]|nr:hypothetical protein [Deltaproteobacteria bacterium]